MRSYYCGKMKLRHQFHSSIGLLIRTQNAEVILNEILKLLNKTSVGWKNMLQFLWIYSAWNPRLRGKESTSYLLQPIQLDLTWSKLNRLYCLAGGFCALQSRISCKIHSESLKNILVSVVSILKLNKQAFFINILG